MRCRSARDVVSIAIQLGVAEADVEVERPVHLPCQIGLEEAVGAALDPRLQEARVGAVLVNQLMAPASIAAEAQRVAPLKTSMRWW